MTDTALTRSVSTSSLTEDWLPFGLGFRLCFSHCWAWRGRIFSAGPSRHPFGRTLQGTRTPRKFTRGSEGWRPCRDLCRIIGSHGKCRRFER